jgi:vancomycin permeability regulator SanA
MDDVKFDAIMCLGTGVNKYGEPSWFLESRINKAVEVFEKHPESKLILSGGKYHLLKEHRPDEADVMLVYIQSHYKIDTSNIILEKNSSTTADQMFELKMTFASANNWKNIAIVSDELHIKRASLIAKYMFGDGYNLYFIASEINIGGQYREVLERYENQKFEYLKNLYKNYIPGDHERIMKGLAEYKKEMKAKLQKGHDPFDFIKL